MRMTFNEELNYYKILKQLRNKKCNIFNDGFENIDFSKYDINQL